MNIKKIFTIGLKAFKGLCYYIYTGKIYKLTPSNIKGYFQGLSRMYDYTHNQKLDNCQEEQFYYRMFKMDQSCINNKMCPCQCEVPAKQFEDRACEKNCYPPMMAFNEWKEFKKVNNINIEKIKIVGVDRFINI